MAVVSRTYAKALFDAAKAKGKLEEVRADLEGFTDALRDVPELDALLRNPQLEPKTKAEAIDRVLGESDELLRNFLRLVAEKGRAAQIDEIAREYEAFVAVEDRVLNVELTTAYELSDEEAGSIVGQIELASGQTVSATRSVEPGLIGGIVLRAGSLRVDASVRSRLDRLRRVLVQRA